MAGFNRSPFPPRRYYSPEFLAKDKPFEDKLLAELEAMHAAARRKEPPKTTSSPIALRAAIAKQIHNTEPKTMPDNKRDSHDITSRLLKHFRKNPPNKQAIAKTPPQQAADDVTKRMRQRYKGNPLVSVGQQPLQQQDQPAFTTKSPSEIARISSMLKNRGLCPAEIKRQEEARQRDETRLNQ